MTPKTSLDRAMGAMQGTFYAWIGALILMLFSGHGAWAQTVVVRAGEHADFTRIVFNVPDRMDVALTYSDRGIDLRFDREGLVFSTDSVFDLIPTTRLTAIEARTQASSEGEPLPNETNAETDRRDRPVVMLSLACRCDIQTSWAGDRAFVVDIRDETVLSAALFAVPELERQARPDAVLQLNPAASPEIRPANAGNRPVRPANQTNATPTTAAPERQTDTARQPMSETEKPGVGSVAFLIADAQERLQELRAAQASGPTQYSDRVRDSQGAILQQIGRAATQGLLEPRAELLPDVGDIEMGESAPSPDVVQTTRANEQMMDKGPAEGMSEPANNITINAQTSMDQAMSERLNIAMQDGQTPGCMNPARVDAAAWAKDAPFIDQIGALRSDIIGEFDQPVPGAIKKLARFYVHFGFGAEAAQVMTMLPKEAQPDAALLAMVNILEEGHDGANSVLGGYMDCDPLVAVWSLLSYEKVPGNEPIDPDGIVRGILNFPVHLRAHVGPIVGEKLRVAGYPGAADHIARALLRNEDTKSTAAAFLNSVNYNVGPDDGPSEAELGEVIADNGQPSAEALLLLINTRLDADTPMSEDMAQLAGAYTTELRDVPMGQEMARAYILSLAVSGMMDNAFVELDRLTGAGPVPLDGTLSDLMDLVARKADDPTFLTHTIGASSAARFAIDDTVGNAVASRLINLGFPDQADAFVAPMALGEAERARKLIRAEIALINEKPRQAELELLGETGDDVMAMIARARSMAGEHNAAQNIFAQINAQEDAERQAFLDGDWDTLQGSADPVIAAVAERQTAPAAAADEEVNQVLARNSAMIEDSQVMRAEIEALLSGVSIPEIAPASDP